MRKKNKSEKSVSTPKSLPAYSQNSRPATQRSLRQYGCGGFGLIIGHRSCVPKVKLPAVPKQMGWLWTATDVLGLKRDPYWRPGAISAFVFKKHEIGKKKCVMIDEPEDDKKSAHVKRGRSKTRRRSRSNSSRASYQEKADPAIVVKKKQGNFFIAVQPLKQPETRLVSEFPYSEMQPFRCKIENKTQLDMEEKERKKLMRECESKKVICQAAFDSICQEVFNNIDQEELKNLASQNDECPCSYLQTEVINNLIDYYLKTESVCGGSKSSLAFSEDLQSDLINFVIDSYLNEDVDADDAEGCGCSEDSDASSSVGDWSVEFTPTCARYDPYDDTEREPEKVEQQTQVSEEQLKSLLEGQTMNKRRSGVKVPSVKF